ncbi:MAG: hypothetical protein WBA17_10600 [Saprospiraceae bacterium]
MIITISHGNLVRILFFTILVFYAVVIGCLVDLNRSMAGLEEATKELYDSAVQTRAELDRGEFHLTDMERVPSTLPESKLNGEPEFYDSHRLRIGTGKILLSASPSKD